MQNEKDLSPENTEKRDVTSQENEKRVELKIEKVSLKTGLRGGIHDADRPCRAL